MVHGETVLAAKEEANLAVKVKEDRVGIKAAVSFQGTSSRGLSKIKGASVPISISKAALSA
jgi:hypothetical protein